MRFGVQSWDGEIPNANSSVFTADNEWLPNFAMRPVRRAELVRATSTDLSPFPRPRSHIKRKIGSITTPATELGMSSFMIYGASGFTGSLIAREAVRRSMRPILAGRSAEKLSELAGELNLEHRIFSLDSSSAV